MMIIISIYKCACFFSSLSGERENQSAVSWGGYRTTNSTNTKLQEKQTVTGLINIQNPHPKDLRFQIDSDYLECEDFLVADLGGDTFITTCGFHYKRATMHYGTDKVMVHGCNF